MTERARKSSGGTGKASRKRTAGGAGVRKASRKRATGATGTGKGKRAAGATGPGKRSARAAGTGQAAGSETGRGPRLESYTLSSLDQIKVLADPLRIRILEALCRERTTKQVAEILGEKPTKLYHHVDALEKVGLIELSRTAPNRGTLEKYYVAVAHSFRADAQAFQSGEGGDTGEEAETLRRMMATIFDTTAGELADIIDRGGAARALEAEGIVSFLEIRASAADLAEIQGKLHELVQSLASRCEGPAGGSEGPDVRRFRLTLAYYPLDDDKEGT